MKLFSRSIKMPPRDKKGSVTVIIAAAGSGTRMGGVPKPLIKLCKKYAVEYSLEAFSALDDVTRIVISTRAEDVDLYRQIAKNGNFDKVVAVIEGGSTRQESVTKAFKAAFDEKITDFVAIHDGARPLICSEHIEKAISEAKKYGCAVCASLCPDTVKRASESGFVTESVDREGLYLISTPQIFSYEIYSAAIAKAERDGFEGTDDSSLVTYADFKIRLCDIPRDNIKLTYPDDVAFAEAVLSSRNKGLQEGEQICE